MSEFDRPSCACQDASKRLNADAAQVDVERTRALALGMGAFDPKQKPPEWNEISRERFESWLSSDYGEIHYACQICGSRIKVEWQDQDVYDEVTHLLCPTPNYWVSRVEPAVRSRTEDHVTEDHV